MVRRQACPEGVSELGALWASEGTNFWVPSGRVKNKPLMTAYAR